MQRYALPTMNYGSLTYNHFLLTIFLCFTFFFLLGCFLPLFILNNLPWIIPQRSCIIFIWIQREISREKTRKKKQINKKKKKIKKQIKTREIKKNNVFKQLEKCLYLLIRMRKKQKNQRIYMKNIFFQHPGNNQFKVPYT